MHSQNSTLGLSQSNTFMPLFWLWKTVTQMILHIGGNIMSKWNKLFLSEMKQAIHFWVYSVEFEEFIRPRITKISETKEFSLILQQKWKDVKHKTEEQFLFLKDHRYINCHSSLFNVFPTHTMIIISTAWTIQSQLYWFLWIIEDIQTSAERCSLHLALVCLQRAHCALKWNVSLCFESNIRHASVLWV